MDETGRARGGDFEAAEMAASGGPGERPGNVPTVTTLLVDDHAIWREGVRSLLQRTEFQIVGEAATAAEALEQARALRPRLALLDVRLTTGGSGAGGSGAGGSGHAGGGGDGLDALQAIKRECPQTAVLMLTTYENPHYLARAVAGGAAGYLLKGVGREDLLRSLRAVTAGEMLLGREDLARGLREAAAVGNATLEAARRNGSAGPVGRLSAREGDVLRLLSSGLSNRDIASALSLSEHTVKSHVDHVLAKLGVSDRVQAAVWAVRSGLVPDPD